MTSDEKSVDLLVLAPHLDDAALSCGGRIHAAAAAGERVVVATVETADPPAEGLSELARELHRTWGGGEVMATRREEDRAACAHLGAEALHLDCLDALYRADRTTGKPLYGDLRALFGEPAAADPCTAEDLVTRFSALPQASLVLAPLAIGGHVDHRLVHRAARRAFADRVLYYEDFPYARSRKARWLARRDFWSWQSEDFAVPGESLAVKVAAIECYASQLGTAFGDREDLRRQVEAEARRCGGERFWRRR